jgi:putative membrane protein
MLTVEDELGEITGFNSFALLIFASIFLVVYAILTLYRIIYYRLSGYELTEREIICLRGVLFRKRSIIEYDRIHAINKKQNIFQRLFGIATLSVDSGSANTGHRAEITVIEDAGVVDDLLTELRALRESGVKNTDAAESKSEILITDSDPLYRFTSPKKILYSLITIASSAFFTGAYGLLLAVLIGICNTALRLDFLGTFGQYALWAVIILLGAMLFVSLISFIGTVIQSFVTYYSFKIEKRDNDIIISYGLFEKHENSFSYDRIRGVKITQGLVQRALGFAEIKLEVIGYVQESDKNDVVTLGVLVPFCRIQEASEIIDKILPEYKPTEKQTRSPALFPHLSWFTLILVIVSSLTAVCVLVPMAILGLGATSIGIAASVICILTLVILLTKLISAYLTYKTAGVAIDGDKITAYNGGFVKEITITKARNLSSVERIATPMQRKAGIESLVLHMRTNAATNEIKVKHQPIEIADIVTDIIRL